MKVTYQGTAYFKIPQDVVLNNLSGHIEKASLSADGSKITIEFITNFDSEVKALNATHELVKEIERKIFFHWNKEILNIECKKIEMSTSNEDTKIIILQDRVNLQSSIQVISSVSNDEIANFSNAIDSNRQETSYFKLFFDIAKMNDKIGSFIMLYSLLLLVIDSRQRIVDEYILDVYPEIETRETTREDRNYHETLYTWLRNQLGHLKEDGNSAQINQEILSCYNSFVGLVRQALIDRGHA